MDAVRAISQAYGNNRAFYNDIAFDVAKHLVKKYGARAGRVAFEKLFRPKMSRKSPYSLYYRKQARLSKARESYRKQLNRYRKPKRFRRKNAKRRFKRGGSYRKSKSLSKRNVSSLYRLQRRENGHLLLHNPRQGWTNITNTAFHHHEGSLSTTERWRTIAKIADVSDVFMSDLDQASTVPARDLTETCSPEWQIHAERYDKMMVQKVKLHFSIETSMSDPSGNPPAVSDEAEMMDFAILIQYGDFVKDIYPDTTLTDGLTPTDTTDWQTVKRRIQMRPGRTFIVRPKLYKLNGRRADAQYEMRFSITVPVYKAFNLREKLYDVTDSTGARRFEVDISNKTTGPTGQAYLTHGQGEIIPLVMQWVNTLNGPLTINQRPHFRVKCVRTCFVRFYDRTRNWVDEVVTT